MRVLNLTKQYEKEDFKSFKEDFKNLLPKVISGEIKEIMLYYDINETSVNCYGLNLIHTPERLYLMLAIPDEGIKEVSFKNENNFKNELKDYLSKFQLFQEVIK